MHTRVCLCARGTLRMCLSPAEFETVLQILNYLKHYYNQVLRMINGTQRMWKISFHP